MKLKISRSQSESSGVLGGKKRTYSLKLVAEMTGEEVQLLSKYGFLDDRVYFDPEICAEIETKKQIRGPSQISLSSLQKGIEWSCSELLLHLTNIPTAVASLMGMRLGVASARENWGGEETIDCSAVASPEQDQ